MNSRCQSTKSNISETSAVLSVGYILHDKSSFVQWKITKNQKKPHKNRKYKRNIWIKINKNNKNNFIKNKKIQKIIKENVLDLKK